MFEYKKVEYNGHSYLGVDTFTEDFICGKCGYTIDKYHAGCIIDDKLWCSDCIYENTEPIGWFIDKSEYDNYMCQMVYPWDLNDEITPDTISSFDDIDCYEIEEIENRYYKTLEPYLKAQETMEKEYKRIQEKFKDKK